MTEQEPRTGIDTRYSAPGARPAAWRQARGRLAAAGVYWLTTVRPDGRPHVTPLIGVWHAGAVHFCTGAQERKARNLAASPHCVVTTGRNDLGAGMDVVLEGDAVPVTDEAVLRTLADLYEAKYGTDWRFEVRDGAFRNAGGGSALVFRVAPSTAFGFAKDPYAQTRWRFAA